MMRTIENAGNLAGFSMGMYVALTQDLVIENNISERNTPVLL